MANDKNKNYVVLEEVEVELLDLTDEQIYKLSKDDAYEVLFAYKKLYEDAEKDLKECEKYSELYKVKIKDK